MEQQKQKRYIDRQAIIYMSGRKLFIMVYLLSSTNGIFSLDIPNSIVKLPTRSINGILINNHKRVLIYSFLVFVSFNFNRKNKNHQGVYRKNPNKTALSPLSFQGFIVLSPSAIIKANYTIREYSNPQINFKLQYLIFIFSYL